MNNINHRLLSKKYLPFIATISVTLLAFTVFLHLGVLEKERYRASVISKSAAVNERLEKRINAAHALTRWMIAYVSLHPGFKNSDFERLAKEIIAHDRNIRHLALAKDNVITHIYPLKGNETALGLGYLEHPEQRASVLKAIETKDTVVAGPVSLVQGGTGFIIRTPIYLEPNGTSIANRQYWGLASVVVDTDALFKEAGLFSEKELKFAMRGKDGAGADGDVFFGDDALFRSDPVITDVILPVGSWQLAAMPKAGWSLAATPLWLKAVRLAIVLLLGSLTFRFFSSQQNIINSEKRYRNIFNNASVSIWEEDFSEIKKAIDGLKAQGVVDFRKYLDENPEFARRAIQTVRVIDVNDATLKLYKAKSKEELLGSLDKVFTPESYLVLKEILIAIAKGETYFEGEAINKNLQGDFLNTIITVAIPSETSKFSNLLVSIFDISERKRAEKTIRENKDRLHALTQTAIDAIISADSAGNIISWNKGAQTIFGYEENEAVGRPFTILIPERYKDAHEKGLERVKTGGEARIIGKTIDLHGLRKNGGEFPLEISLATWKTEKGVFFTGIIRDITARKKMEAELAKKGKLESIGILAGGIAHDFNNLLTGILGNISLTKIRMRTDNKDYSLLSEAENTCMQMSELTRKLITFSDGGSPFRKVASISSIINEKECSELCGPEISCQCEIPQGLSPLYVDDWQIRQVFKNMVINAKEAMPEGGVIRVRAENIVLDKGDGVLKEGRYVMITIKDSGKGIPKDILPKIFDPYFTTKEMGAQKGMGLGLAVCYSIVKKHKGHIAVESKRGEGTTFHVYLPAAG